MTTTPAQVFYTTYFGPTDYKPSRIRVRYMTYHGPKTVWASYDSNWSLQNLHLAAVGEVTGIKAFRDEFKVLDETLDERGYVIVHRSMLTP